MIDPEVRRALAPTGRLRAALNFANTIVTQRDRGDGQPGGVAVELARALARRLDVGLDLVGFDSPADVIEALLGSVTDIGFVASDPARAETLDFTEPYVLIECTYLVPSGSDIWRPSQVDRSDMRVAVMKGAAFDLFLTRNLKAAQLVRGGGDYLGALASGDADVAAGVRQALDAAAKFDPRHRVLPEHFSRIGQAVATAKDNPAAALLRHFVNEMIAIGFIADALTSSGQSAAIPAAIEISERRS